MFAGSSLECLFEIRVNSNLFLILFDELNTREMERRKDISLNIPESNSVDVVEEMKIVKKRRRSRNIVNMWTIRRFFFQFEDVLCTVRDRI